MVSVVGYSISEYLLIAYSLFVFVFLFGCAWIAEILSMEGREGRLLLKRWEYALGASTILMVLAFVAGALPLRIGTVFFIDGLLAAGMARMVVRTVRELVADGV